MGRGGAGGELGGRAESDERRRMEGYDILEI